MPAGFVYVCAALALLTLALIYWRRQRVASPSEVLAVTLVSLLIVGVAATILLLDLYARSLPWQLTVARLVLLTFLSYFTVLVINAARKKELMPKKLRLTLIVIPAIILVLFYYWNIAWVIIVTLIALLIVVATIRASD